MMAQTMDAEAYLERLLNRLGIPRRGRYKTGTVAQVLGYSREWIRQRTELPADHPSHIAMAREGRDRFISHDELVRLIAVESER